MRGIRLYLGVAVVMALAACLPGRWQSDEQEAASRLLAQGAAVYAAHCQGCHGDQAARTNASGAPPHNQHGHTWHHPDPQLKDWVRNGKPSTQMPAYGDRVNEAEIEAVIALIKTWWTPEQARIQADVTRNYQDFVERR